MTLKDSGLSLEPVLVITQKESVKDLWNHFSIYVIRDILLQRWRTSTPNSDAIILPSIKNPDVFID